MFVIRMNRNLATHNYACTSDGTLLIFKSKVGADQYKKSHGGSITARTGKEKVKKY
jgi:hypothetical protein